ncbi:hypothetical protein F4821DRAFT_67707 [Hypoxylon rubiginosum]|uniref:Uncharacterized protein n=1 Tax=Hypoxylon rubiginosum TaxID=110542 RepID=A0ACC0CIW9_9PEZI|nr:hypothetical protein F4821DRAFT_67707 [Hypoxylon rubiginosum]
MADFFETGIEPHPATFDEPETEAVSKFTSCAPHSMPRENATVNGRAASPSSGFTLASQSLQALFSRSSCRQPGGIDRPIRPKEGNGQENSAIIDRQGIFENAAQSDQTLNGCMPMGYLATERGISVNGCDACGVSTTHLLRLTEKALQWCPADDLYLETLLESGVIRPDAGRGGVMLRLCLWALRDYALAVVSSTGKSTKDGLGDCAIEPTEKCFQHQPATTMDDIPPTRSDSTSNGRSSLDRTEVSDTNSDGGYKARMDDQVIRCDQRRRGRWSEIDKNRLRVYMEEGKDLGWIAKKLGRSEDKVNEYGKKLKALQRRRSPRKARSKRTTGL